MKYTAMDSIGFRHNFYDFDGGLEEACRFLDVVDKGADRYIFFDHKSQLAFIGGLEDVIPYVSAAYCEYKATLDGITDYVDYVTEYLIELKKRFDNRIKANQPLYFDKHRYEVYKMLED